MNRIITLILLFFIGFITNAQNTQELLDFEFEGVQLSGVLDLPKNKNPKGIVLIVHGDGKTNAVAGNWYNDVRNAILSIGYATYMWDKMGCGRSGGEYKNGQPVENGALEVIAAIENLKESKIKGADKIGLWGISRAGWINPIVIDQYKKIDFWISVSGVDDDETFKYLLEQNFRIEGHPKDTVDLLVKEWHNGILLSRGGASYEYAQAASPNLRKNKFWLRFTNGGITEKGYYEYQKILQETPLDSESELPLYIENFEEMLSKIRIPVLALFGESDMHVNWRQTKNLYERVLKPNTNLTIKSFENCNHNILQCKTGGFYEFQDTKLEYVRCDGFLEAITSWLNSL